MFWWVVGLSIVGAGFELSGIILVSGRWDAIKRSVLRLPPRLRKPPPIVVPIGVASEQDSAQTILPGSDAAQAAARGRMLDALSEATRADVAAVGRQASSVTERLDRLEAELPDEIRRRTAAPVWGVVCLVIGLGCFVAANIVGAA